MFTTTELASKTKAVCDTVKSQGCAFITNNGKADCMMIDISDFESLNDAVHSFDRWLAQRKLDAIWAHNAASKITAEDINEEICAVRSNKANNKTNGKTRSKAR